MSVAEARYTVRSSQSLYSNHESGEMDIELSVLSVSLDCYCVLGNQSNIKTGGKTKVFEMAEVFVSAFVFRYCICIRVIVLLCIVLRSAFIFQIFNN